MQQIQLLSRGLTEINARSSASEVHGFISGWLCAGSEWIKPNDELYEVLEVTPTTSFNSLLDELAVHCRAGLADDDFGFSPMLPMDDEEINLRRQGLSDWCRGFLTGFGLTGRFQESDLSDEVAEVFKDFANISQVEDQMSADEENEADLLEIIEYVRIGAILVFTESQQRAIH